MIYLLTLVTPLITMRLIAEEKSRGTIETMMTAPVSEWSFVLAKFLASFLFVCYLVFPTICYVVLAGKYGDVDKGATLVGYIGILLGIAPILAIGLLISSLSANQITAGVLTLIASMLLMILPLIAIRLPEGSWWSEFLRGAFDQVNILGHMEAYARGVLDSRSCVYLVSVVFLFLFLTVRILESRRWR
jgi:ABC-2 type transport system permease protein